VVRGIAWSVPVVTLAAHAPAFAASTNAPGPGSLAVTCRTQGQGRGNCQGYRVVLNFQMQGTTSWNIRITTANITSTAGATVEIKQPAVFPYVVSPSASSMDLWFCAESSPSGLTLNISYTAWQVGTPESTAVTLAFPQQVYPGDSIPVCP